jgi:hypothetical protein
VAKLRSRRRARRSTSVKRPTIYFVRCELTGLTKIGFTTRNSDVRLRESQTFAATPLRFLVDTPGTKEQEKLLHEVFNGSRDHGEWFRPSPELDDLIDSLVEAGEGLSGIYDSSTSPDNSFLGLWLADRAQTVL